MVMDDDGDAENIEHEESRLTIQIEIEEYGDFSKPVIASIVDK